MRPHVVTRSVVLAVFVLAAALPGCGKDGDKGKKSADDFRIPDSLLTPIEGFNITIDEYHPIRGGVLANKDIELHYPASHIARYLATSNFGFAFNAHRKVLQDIGRPAPGGIVIIGAKDLAEYQFLTKKEWWYYGVIQGDTLYFEPFDVMMKRYDRVSRRSLGEIGLTQKISQMALKNLSRDRIPLWMRESIASWLAGEKSILKAQAAEFNKELIGYNPGLEELERNLSEAVDRGPTRVSFFIAYTMLENLLEKHAMSEIIVFARRLGEGAAIDDASREVFGMDYGKLVETVGIKGDFTDYLEDLLQEVPRKDGGN